jgi:DNA (cytosine-5)-methyltransferase 1
MGFTYADLFAGIGGFHAAMEALGGECRFVSEIDEAAVGVYRRNWLPRSSSLKDVDRDIVPLTENVMRVPKTDVLAAGFPCQPFSKSGFQRGINETRGTLFFNILRILQERRPSLVLLENVRNLAGPRHTETWNMIVRQLRDAGYKVSSTPTVFSPHFLPPDHGGTPQVRDRVFILATYVGSAEKAHELSGDQPVVPRAPVRDLQGELWSPERWDIEDTVLPFIGEPLLQDEGPATAPYRLTPSERMWIECWDDFVQRMWEKRDGKRLPGFPLWADCFQTRDELEADPAYEPETMPTWKRVFMEKNADFYEDERHREAIDTWKADWDDLAALPASRRKLEWQAQDAASLWDCVMHMRPSGIRAKRATYLPALVAITQTSIIGPRQRRLTPREAARLQGLPDWFEFGDQGDPATYKQLGNGVSVGAAYYVLREHVRQDRHLLPRRIADAVLEAGPLPLLLERDGAGVLAALGGDADRLAGQQAVVAADHVGVE